MTDKTSLQAEFEKALEKLIELCDPNIELEERKFRLAVQKEWNRMFDLHGKAFDREIGGEESGVESAELAEVWGHLEPLGLAPKGTPAAELARLAALKIAQR